MAPLDRVGIRCKRWSDMRTVIYPGSFDPLTNGHLDLIQRAAHLFDRVIVAVADNDIKTPLFTLDERLELVNRSIRDMKNVEADRLVGLLADYVVHHRGQAVLRGLRAVSDFEFEFQLALMNRKLDERVETIFMMPRETYVFLSSRVVKEIARLGGEVTAFVPAHVRKALIGKFQVGSSPGKDSYAADHQSSSSGRPGPSARRPDPV
jgi:pantetheine-phosphate adenylyltransferase